MKLTLEAAERVLELQKEETPWKEVFNLIQDEFPSLRLKRYPACEYILIRQAHALLNTDTPTHNID